MLKPVKYIDLNPYDNDDDDDENTNPNRLVSISKIYVTTNIAILIFVSTCKQQTQSGPMKFSKNGVFHSKGVVIIFSK